MALQLNGSSQYLTAPWARGIYPVSVAFWVRLDVTNKEHSLVCFGNPADELSFHNIQATEDSGYGTRVISFDSFAQANFTPRITSTTVYQHVAVRFLSNSLQISINGGTWVTQGWSPSATQKPNVWIGNSVSDSIFSYLDGAIEHLYIALTSLSDAQFLLHYDQSVNPAEIETASIFTYLPLVDSLTPAVGQAFTGVNLASPTYETSGISYPGGGTTYTVSYNGNGAESGTAPTDASSPYDDGATVTVLGNTGTLAIEGYTFDGWNTAANGSGTDYAPAATFTIGANTVLYAQWAIATAPAKTINHTNFDPTALSNAQITAAAALKVYFEHASTGQDIFGNSSTDSSAGTNYNDTEPCGLAELYALNNRYLCDRDHAEDLGNDYTWFATHNGLQTNRRNNPPPATKLSGFLALSADMRSAVQVAMYKYCWIDVWPDTEGYVSDGAAYAASEISQRETFEAANPGIVVPYWTMPLQSNEGYAQRDAYNRAIRTYCATNDKWLIDIADIENFTAAGVRATDIDGHRVADSAQMMPDGGHIASSGRIRMAMAYWSMIAGIAEELTPPDVYRISDITRDKDGEPLGSVVVSLFSADGAGVYAYVGTTTSDATTGVFSFDVADGTTEYMCYYHIEGTPNRFDASDNTLTGTLI